MGWDGMEIHHQVGLAVPAGWESHLKALQEQGDLFLTIPDGSRQRSITAISIQGVSGDVRWHSSTVMLGLLPPQGVMESFLGTAMAGSMFCLFAGQPLIILSSTGPILIFEKLLFDFSK